MDDPLYSYPPSYIMPSYYTGFYNLPYDYESTGYHYDNNYHYPYTYPSEYTSSSSYLYDPSPFQLSGIHEKRDSPDLYRHSKKKTSKSSYIISLIDRRYFIDYGAYRLQSSNHNLEAFEVYYVLKMYDGTPRHETCALLGIPVRYWSELILNESNLLRYIRSGDGLSHIQDIQNLSTAYINDVFHRFRDAFKDIISRYNPDDLILLNIEPRGNGKLEKSYPVPYITVPGGGMDSTDTSSFEKCGLREFEEETGIDIRQNHIRLCEEKIVRKKTKSFDSSLRAPIYPQSNSYASFSSCKWKQPKGEDYSCVMMFYLVRIIYPISIGLPPGL